MSTHEGQWEVNVRNDVGSFLYRHIFAKLTPNKSYKTPQKRIKQPNKQQTIVIDFIMLGEILANSMHHTNVDR